MGILFSTSGAGFQGFIIILAGYFPHAGMEAGRLVLAHRGDEVLGCVTESF